MQTEDHSQSDSAQTTEDPSLIASQPVTAAGQTPADNATPPQQQVNQAPPAEPVGGPTGEGVGLEDDSMEAYQNAKKAFLDAPPPAAAPVTETPPAAALPAAPVTTAPGAPTAVLPREDDIPALGPDGKIPQIKLRPENQEDFQMLSEWKASQRAGNKDSLTQFIAKRAVPTAAPAAAAPVQGDTPPEASTAPATPTTVAEADARLAELKRERWQSMQAFDFDRAQELEAQEEQLRGVREGLLVNTAHAQQTAQQVFAAKEGEYAQKAAALYPDSAKVDSPLCAKAGEIMEQWQREGDPRANHPSRMLYVFVEAADALGVKPSAAAAPAPTHLPQQPTPPPVNRHTPPLSALIAGGDARTQQPAARPLDIDSIDSVKSYQEAKAAVLNGRRAIA